MTEVLRPSLYVYYRIPANQEAAAHRAAVRMTELLAARGLERPALMRRPEASAQGLQTWMEVYPRWDPDSAAIVDRALADSGLGALIEGPRHPELFMDLPPLERGDET